MGSHPQLRTGPSFNRAALLGLAGIFAMSFVLTIVAIPLTALSANRMVVWPVDGMILAIMLGPLNRNAYSTLIVGKIASILGAFVLASTSFSLSVTMSTVTGLSTCCIYLVMRRFIDEDKFTHSKGLYIFLVIVAIASLLLGFSESILFHIFIHYPLFKMVLSGAASNAVGYAVITPLLLILTRSNFTNRALNVVYGQNIAIGALCCALVVVVFWQTRYAILYPIPLALIVLAYTTDMAIVAIVVLFTTITAYTATVLGHGPVNLTPGPIDERVLVLQAFLIVIVATSLPIAALMAEHERLKKSLIAARIDAEKASRAKSAFLATISHEIRTPLNGVLGMAQVMASGELSAVQRERIEIVRSSGETLMSLLNDVLDMSKIEAGKIILESVEFDFGALVSQVMEVFEPSAKSKGLRMRLELGNADGVLMGDSTRIRQILTNLVSNAMKFTHAGEIALMCAHDDTGLRVSVSDTGIGIPAEKLHCLFTRFSQADTSTTRQFGGTGLGLSICRELAELMGGSIEVESCEGKGSTFHLRLPLQKVRETKKIAQSKAPVPQRMPSEGVLVLAAEDNAMNRKVLEALLQTRGISVQFVENGAQAVQAWESGSWDVILMDIHMPVMDGPTAAGIIRSKEAALGRPRIPIVALTANTMKDQVDTYIAAGMDAHIGKPIMVDDLFAVLERFCKFRQDGFSSIQALAS